MQPVVTRSAVRLIVTDLDGTLLGPGGELSPRTVTAIEAARTAGYAFAVVTARPPRGAFDVAERLRLDGLVLCSNGALWLDAGRRTLRRTLAVDAGTMRAVVRRLRSDDPSVAFALELGMQYVEEKAFVCPVVRPADTRVVRDVIELRRPRPAKMVVWHPERDAATLERWVRRRVGGRVCVTRSDGPFVELSARGVDKAHAVRLLARAHGVRACDVLAIGDGPNDVSMLRWAGWGIAMANAPRAVRAQAPFVAPTNAADGVAVVLEALVRGGPAALRRFRRRA